MYSHSIARQSSANILRTVLRSTAPSSTSGLPGLHVASISKPLASTAFQKRAFAAKRRIPPAPKLVRRQASPSAPTVAEMYDLASISFRDFEQIILENKDSFNKLSPTQYYEGLSKFCEAVKNGSPVYSVRLPGGKTGQSLSIE